MDLILNVIGVMIIMFGFILYLGIDKLFPKRKEQLKQKEYSQDRERFTAIVKGRDLRCSNLEKSPKQECNPKYNK